jgi:hypothetical protein
MITDPERFASSKRLALAADPLSLEQKFRILDSLLDEARRLGKFDENDCLLGLDDDIRLAAALNANVSSSPR